MLLPVLGLLLLLGLAKPSSPISRRGLSDEASGSSRGLRGQEAQRGLGVQTVESIFVANSLASPASLSLQSEDSALLGSSLRASFASDGGPTAEGLASERGFALLAALVLWEEATAEELTLAITSRSSQVNRNSKVAAASPTVSPEAPLLYAADLEKTLRAFAIPPLQVRHFAEHNAPLERTSLHAGKTDSVSDFKQPPVPDISSETEEHVSSAEQAVRAARRRGLASLASLSATGRSKLCGAAKVALKKSEKEGERSLLSSLVKTAFSPPASLEVEASLGESTPTRFALRAVSVVEESGLYASVQSQPGTPIETLRFYKLLCAETDCAERPSLRPADLRENQLRRAKSLLRSFPQHRLPLAVQNGVNETEEREDEEEEREEEEEEERRRRDEKEDTDVAALREKRVFPREGSFVRKTLLRRLKKRLLLPKKIGHLALSTPVVAVGSKELLVNSVEVYDGLLVKLHRLVLHSAEERWSAAFEILETASLLDATGFHLETSTPATTWIDASSGRLFFGGVESLTFINSQGLDCEAALKNTWPQYLPPEKAALCLEEKKMKTQYDEGVKEKRKVFKTQQTAQAQHSASSAWNCGLQLFDVFCSARLPFGLSAVAAPEDALSHLEQLFLSGESSDKRLSLTSCEDDPRARWLLQSLLKVHPAQRARPLDLFQSLLIKEAVIFARQKKQESETRPQLPKATVFLNP